MKRSEILDDYQNTSMNKIDEIDVHIVEEQDMIEDIRKEIELPKGVLETNLFIPSAIVCSKVDLIEHGESNLKNILEHNIDFI